MVLNCKFKHSISSVELILQCHSNHISYIYIILTYRCRSKVSLANNPSDKEDIAFEDKSLRKKLIQERKNSIILLLCGKIEIFNR